LTHRTIEPRTEPTSSLTLYPRDTVLRALEVMHRYGVHQLAVVDERHGELLGTVTEEELHRIWHTLPLARMREILSARAALATEGSAAERPCRLVFVPGGQGGRSAWVH
jgi:CBS-domain-containing membrane protein